MSQITLYDTGILQAHLGLEKLETINDKLLCQAYKKLGHSLPSFLNGDFSFVLYDPEKEYYFCARDPLGIKSFYYTKTGSDYSFSSTIGELLKLPGVSKKPNLTSMSTMLYSSTVDYDETMYEGIYRLPPGHFMVIENGEERMERYWYPEKIEINYSITEEEVAKKLRVLFSNAVEKRISSPDETAFEMSGGLDSTAVVSTLAQRLAPSAIESYSMDFKGLECDESEYVDAVLEKYPLDHQKISTEKLDYQKTYSLEYLYAMSPNWPITMTFAMAIPMLERMKQDGKRVILSGQGGDHLFTGTPYIVYDLFRRFEILALYREMKSYQKRWGAAKAYIIKPLLGKKVTHFIETLFGKKYRGPFVEESGIEDLSQKVGVKNPVHQNELDAVTSAAHSTMMDGNFFHCAEEYFGIEYRHPFFDLELVEFALSLPPEMKYREKTIKWIWRKAMQGILPDKINNRTDKAEFSEVIIQQIDAIDLNELLDDPYIVKLGLMEQSLIDEERKAYEDKTSYYIVFFWTIINMEYWYRVNFTEDK